jgi:hypothetical protein
VKLHVSLLCEAACFSLSTPSADGAPADRSLGHGGAMLDVRFVEARDDREIDRKVAIGNQYTTNTTPKQVYIFRKVAGATRGRNLETEKSGGAMRLALDPRTAH